MRIILMGPPGAGKGTQANFISANYHIFKISTGDILRQVIQDKTELGLEIKSIVDKGALVSDEIIIRLVKETIQRDCCVNGFLLDGFPRTLEQAKVLAKSNLNFDYILELKVPDSIIIERISGRRVHLQSGRIYHKVYNPPRQDGLDDITGEPLVQREDDQEDTIRRRLKIYHEYTQPVIDFYANSNPQHPATLYHAISGLGTVDEVSQRLSDCFEK